MSLFGSPFAENSAGRYGRAHGHDRLWSARDLSWPRRVIGSLRGKRTLLYRSKDEFGLFEFGGRVWKEVARLQDSAKPGAQRLFRYLLQNQAAQARSLPLRLSADYVECIRFKVSAETPEAAATEAANQLVALTPRRDEEFWSGFVVLGARGEQPSYDCVGAFARKSDLDELSFRLGGFGWTLGAVEFADVESDALIQLARSALHRVPVRRGEDWLLRASATALFVLTMAAAINFAWLLGERTELSDQLRAVQAQSAAARADADSSVSFPPDLAEIAPSRIKIAELIEHISALLPGDVVLTSLRVEDDEVLFSGSARKSVNLVDHLNSSDLLSDAVHAIPSVRLEGRQVELFSIRATLNSRKASDGRT